ncbi:hypothetical protein CALCODRAFT_98333 [Calocera cornea HHB12733]|uniref:Uncharacterized protein n=1 Tax=Calocera cornea HHB12733 TaxID=1353952 RepID=A0A165IKQ4_9BASI|nr:hypothetical protein CALCODRAFT_98333 [Calocera cornea HHB12733]
MSAPWTPAAGSGLIVRTASFDRSMSCHLPVPLHLLACCYSCLRLDRQMPEKGAPQASGYTTSESHLSVIFHTSDESAELHFRSVSCSSAARQRSTSGFTCIPLRYHARSDCGVSG